MYFVWLFLAAFLLIFFFSTNWPIKIYHNYYLKKLALRLQSVVQNDRSGLMGPSPEVNTIYQGKQLKIRFIEGSADTLQSGSGLEIRFLIPHACASTVARAQIIEFYRLPGKRQEWGDFIRFQTGDPEIDSRWFILTPDPTAAASFWEKSGLKKLLTVNQRIEQLSVNQAELIFKLRDTTPIPRMMELIDGLAGLFPETPER